MKITTTADDQTVRGALRQDRDVGRQSVRVKFRTQGGEYAYRGVSHRLYSLCLHEGWSPIWNGIPASIIGSSLFSAVQLATYDHAKVTVMKLTGLEHGLQLIFSATVITGLVTTTVTNPADDERQWMTGR